MITTLIDREAGIVRSRVVGCLTDEDVRRTRDEISRDPMFSPVMPQLFDLRDATDIALSGTVMQALASQTIFELGTRRAFLAGNDFQFGMARMFCIYAEHAGQTVAVFRDLDKALAWLGGALSEH